MTNSTDPRADYLIGENREPSQAEQDILTRTPAPSGPACLVCQTPLDYPLPAVSLCGKVACAGIHILGLPF